MNPRNRSFLFGLPVCLGACWLVAAASLAGQSDLTEDDLLGRQMGFSVADLQLVESGAAVIRSLDSPVREEIAYVGMVYIDVPAEHFIDRFRDIEQFESGPGTPLIGRFSDPPKLEDLALLTLPPGDVAALTKCRPGSCGVKLPVAAIQRFQNEVDWSSPAAAAQADQVAREMILDLIRAYQADGNAALGYYDDGDDPLPVAEHFRGVLAGGDPLPVPVPALIAYLDTYPHGRPAAAEEFFYWALVDFGLKPTIRVNHVTIYPLDRHAAPGVAYAIAIKQLYASHYFYTTLELRFLVDDRRRLGSLDTSLISILRSRSDGMTGFKGLFLRPVIRRRSHDAVRGYLDHVKQQVESPVPAAP